MPVGRPQGPPFAACICDAPQSASLSAAQGCCRHTPAGMSDAPSERHCITGKWQSCTTMLQFVSQGAGADMLAAAGGRCRACWCLTPQHVQPWRAMRHTSMLTLQATSCCTPRTEGTMRHHNRRSCTQSAALQRRRRQPAGCTLFHTCSQGVRTQCVQPAALTLLHSRHRGMLRQSLKPVASPSLNVSVLRFGGRLQSQQRPRSILW